MNAAAPGLVYRLLALALYPFWVIHALLHGRRHQLHRYPAMRMAGVTADQQARIWVHAASVGEVHAIAPLVKGLLERGHKILFTSFTATGYQAIQRDFAERVTSSVIPIDCYWHCRRFLMRNNIRLGVVMETELWPELLYQARRKGIELVLVNARLSKKSLQANALVRALLARTLGYFSQILTRNQNDREALQSLGADRARIRILGNLKARPETPSNPARLIERDYLLLASSHAGEEQRLLAARPAEMKSLLVVIAPRHPPRSETIQIEIEALGLRYAVRSKAQPVAAETEVYLADTLGELMPLMAHARIVVMGGSFDDTGGHNLIEPASLGCATITGPSDSNVRSDIDMLGIGQGVLQVDTIEECWSAISKLMANPQEAQRLAAEAQSRIAQQPDVLQKYLSVLNKLLD